MPYHRRNRRPPQRRQIDAVQRLVGKRSRAGRRPAGRDRDRREGEGQLLGLEFRVMDTAGFEDETRRACRADARPDRARSRGRCRAVPIDAREG